MSVVKYAEDKIKEVQNGMMPDRGDFPENMKGEIAKHAWYDPMFSYGMEYGYLMAMLDIKKEFQNG